MRVFRRVLIATDLSDASHAAVDLGSRLVQSLGAQVMVVMSFDPFPYLPGIDLERAEHLQSIFEATEANLRERLDAICGESLPGTGCTISLLREASPARAILAEAERFGADLIVVGSRGRSGWERAVFGSVAAKVVRHAACPVLVAR